MSKDARSLLDAVINRTFFESGRGSPKRVHLDNESVMFLREKSSNPFLPSDSEGITHLVLEDDRMLFDVIVHALQKEEANGESPENITHAFALLSRYQYIFSRTRDAYSYDCYGTLMWLETIRHLEGMGYTDEQIIEIMKSKHTRWASDSICMDADKYFYPMSVDVRKPIKEYFSKERNRSLIDSMLQELGLINDRQHDVEINVKITPDTIISIADGAGIKMTRDEAARVVESLKKGKTIEHGITEAVIEKITEMNLGTTTEPSL